jgi:Protein of unknown function (DUF1761)
MIYIIINAWPITIAALTSVGIGAIWYRKAVPTATLATLIVAQLWLAAILAGALILAPPKGSIWTMTLGSAFVIWIGFVLPVIAASYRLRALPWRSVISDAGYWLVAMLAQAVLLRVIGLTPPPA